MSDALAKAFKDKFVVWVAWKKEIAEKINYGDRVKKDLLVPYVFDTEAEVKAFLRGVTEANGWDSPAWYTERNGKKVFG